LFLSFSGRSDLRSSSTQPVKRSSANELLIQAQVDKGGSTFGDRIIDRLLGLRDHGVLQAAVGGHGQTCDFLASIARLARNAAIEASYLVR
jgi:hypothetical protein